MKKNDLLTDGIKDSHWDKIREFALEYPKKIQRPNKIGYVTDYYLQPLYPKLGKNYPIYQTMQIERMFSIAFQIYKNPKRPYEKEKAIAFLKTLIFDYKHLFS